MLSQHKRPRGHRRGVAKLLLNIALMDPVEEARLARSECSQNFIPRSPPRSPRTSVARAGCFDLRYPGR